MQQTFLSAYRSLLNGVEPRNPPAWLATIARNECWARIQDRKREPLAEPDPESTFPDPVAAAAESVDLAALWQAIGELPRQQREALLLREFSGLSYDELAKALGVSKPAVESLLFRARRRLKVQLQPIYSSTVVTPLGVIRDAFSTGPLAKIASAPVLAKLVAGTAAIVVAGGTVAAVDRRVPRHHALVENVHASTLPLTHADATAAPADPATHSLMQVRRVLARVVHAVSGGSHEVTTTADNAQNPGTDTPPSASDSTSGDTTTNSNTSGDAPSATTTTTATTGENTSGDSPPTTTTTTAATTTTTTDNSSGDTPPTTTDSSGDSGVNSDGN